MDHGYNHRPIIVKEREMRNEARAMMKRELGAKAIEGKDIDHKDPVRAKGGHGGNNMSNLRVRSRHANRLGEKDVGRTRPVSIDGETDWLVDGQASIMPDVSPAALVCDARGENPGCAIRGPSDHTLACLSTASDSANAGFA